MLSLNTNLSSLIAQKSMNNATRILNQSIERMTTGYKVNHAKDNAANYSIGVNMTTKMNSLLVAQENVAMGMDLIGTAEGVIGQIEDKVQRLRDLQIQASNCTYGSDSLKAINAEAQALVKEIDRLYCSAEYNGLNLFGASSTATAQTYSLARTGSRGTTNTGFINQITRRSTDAMTKLSDVDPATKITSGTYSISTQAELVQLSEMAHASNIKGGEFVLANDIDLSSIDNWVSIGSYEISYDEYVSNIVFDGNGYTIKNLTSISSAHCVGLFGVVENSVIKNLALEDVDINCNNTGMAVSTFASALYNTTLENCYSTGNITSTVDDTYLGGLFGIVIVYADIQDCWTDVNLNGGNSAGGIGTLTTLGSANIDNCYSLGDMTSTAVAGILSQQEAFDQDGSLCGYPTKVTNCYSLGKLTGTSSTVGVLYCLDDIYADSVSNCYYNTELNPGISGLISDRTNNATVDAAVGKTTAELTNLLPTLHSVSGSNSSVIPDIINLQVGIYSDQSSQISLSTKFNLVGIDKLNRIGIDKNTDILSIIDELQKNILEKQTHLGAITNRLESVLDEIEIKYSNLASSRSTILDADIAEVSSTYVQQQILQQASSTLLSTANQAPSIALQLI